MDGFFRYNKISNTPKGDFIVKEFLKKYGYTMAKLFVNQFAIALFGIGLWCVGMYGDNTALKIGSSIGAVVFYLFLLYAHMWEIGAKDGISAEARGTARGLWRGFAIGAGANALNILLVILMLPQVLFKGYLPVSGVMKTISMLLHGMYTGFTATVAIGGRTLNQMILTYFIIILPAVLVTGLAYIIGSYNLHLTNILIPKNKDVRNNGRPK